MNHPVPDPNNDVNNLSILSHRRALRDKLQALPPARRKNPVPLIALGVVAVLALTVAYPSWAKDLARWGVLVSERKVATTDGGKITERTYRMEGSQSTTQTGTVRLQADGDGNIQSVQTGVADPALETMKIEAERMIAAQNLRPYLDDGQLRAYKVTLGDGRQITYIQGPGTSWSISQ